MAQEKGSKGFLKIFSKNQDACVFPFNFQARWNGGGSAALPAATAFVGCREERSVHASAATADLRVVAAACVGTPGALAAVLPVVLPFSSKQWWNCWCSD